MAEKRTGTLMPEGYRPRLVEGRLDRLMGAFGCVEVVGARWCGKTWTALSRSASVTRLDRRAEREAALVDPALALVGEAPHLVDEWQEVPEVWDAARGLVDDTGNERGRLLLTGSSALTAEQRERVRHSGTGRIARLRMRPMSLLETGDSTGAASLSALFVGEPLPPCRRDTGVAEVARWCCRGGWPANLGLSDEVAAETSVQYVRSVLDKNVADEGRSRGVALALMRALAANAGRAVTHGTLARDMGASAVSDDTLAAYLALLDRLYITEELPGWEPPLRSKARVRVKPKRHFVDPSLAAALLQATPEALLRDTQTLGDLFEGLVARDLRVYLSTYGGLGDRVSYYRDDKGLECDVILEHGGAWAGIEVKLSDLRADEGAASLLALRRKLTRNPAARVPDPAFLAVVVGAGSLAYRRDDGVYVTPAATLAP